VHYVRGGGSAVAVVKRIAGVLQTRYLHKDHLGSVVALTDPTGAVLERYSYDPWGKRRDATSWAASAPGTFAIDPAYTDRGFTGHEHVEHVGLINMNGRLYDPELGKFLSADPTTQFPESTQGWNRYAYTGNNPLSHTDPSGFSISGILKAIGIAAVSFFTAGVATAWIAGASISSVFAGTAVGLSSGSIAGGAFFGGFTGGFLASGGDFKTAILSGVGAMLTAGIGSMFGNVTFGESPLRFLEKAFTHGLVQGGLNSSLGGNFVDGLLGGFAGSAFEPFAGIVESASNSPILATITAAVVGGTVAAIGGGKFANGAASAAFVDLFNRRGHRDSGWRNPTGGANRKCDEQGCGSFGDPRGGRFHMGLDIVGEPGQQVVAARDGVITRISGVYRSPTPATRDLRYIEITSPDGYSIRQMYVAPADGISVGTTVRAGQGIGTLQRLPYEGITQHVHVEIRFNGQIRNPQGYMQGVR
jgi:RHS repeat-associated protein